MFYIDDPFAAFDIAEHLRDCITPKLATTTRGLPNRVCIHTGEIAWDDCECGQLVVSFIRSFETAVFPTPWDGTGNSGALKCGASVYAFEYQVSMLRCAAGADGETPDCSELNQSARGTIEDAWAVMAGLSCCKCNGLQRDPDTGIQPFQNFLIGEQIMDGPEGGCQGSLVTVTVGIKNGGYPCGTS